MKSICAFVLLTLPSLAADRDDVRSAAQNLAGQANYSWRTRVDASIWDPSLNWSGVTSIKPTFITPLGSRHEEDFRVGPRLRRPDEGRFRVGPPFRIEPSVGVTEKGGFTVFSLNLGNSAMREAVEVVIKGDRIAFKRNGEWRALGGPGSDEAPAISELGQRLRAFKAPAEEAQDLLRNTLHLENTGEAFSGDLMQETVRELLDLRLGRLRHPGEPLPQATRLKGSVSFWVKNGQLTKYNYTLQGAFQFGSSSRSSDFVVGTTTIEIFDVGTTKVQPPGAASQKL